MRAVVTLAALLLAGCLAPAAEVGPAGLDGVAGYATSRGWSMPTTPALYAVLEGVEELVPSVDGTPMSIGIFRPDMPGCDWDAEALPETCRLPIVMDAGPYYAARVDVDKYRPPTIEWLVPRGYAVVQMSLRGTGESGGCMEFKTPRDVEDIDAVITDLAARAWSNGNVGMIGRSYDGTSAWAGAASGNPALKAIVPISGAVDAPGLYYKNGTSETRGFLHTATYYPTNGLALEQGPGAQKAEDVCKEGLVDPTVEGPTAGATGDASSEYWRLRDLRPLILENYRGAVWTIHGLHDWNVNPSQAVPWIRTMHEAGIPSKAWLGVWGHAYPDRVDEHRNVRWDWADQTVRFFDFYLKGEGEAPSMDVEVEDSLFTWRREATYPPQDAVFAESPLDGARTVSGVAGATWRFEPLAEAVRVAGLPQLHLDVVPTTATGGHLFAELYDVYPDGRSVRIGWAAMNLRFHAGGNTEPGTLVPGQPVRALMEFEPVDAHVARGHALRLVVHKEGVEDIAASPDPSPVQVTAGVLRLPTVVRDATLEGYAAPGLG